MAEKCGFWVTRMTDLRVMLAEQDKLAVFRTQTFLQSIRADLQRSLQQFGPLLLQLSSVQLFGLYMLRRTCWFGVLVLLSIAGVVPRRFHLAGSGRTARREGFRRHGGFIFALNRC